VGDLFLLSGYRNISVQIQWLWSENLLSAGFDKPHQGFEKKLCITYRMSCLQTYVSCLPFITIGTVQLAQTLPKKGENHDKQTRPCIASG
jgi:hypothetical protein